MSEVLKETVKFGIADTMTIPQLQNAKKIVKAKLDVYKNDRVISNKLTNMLYDYEKKEKAINMFYAKCKKHKNPDVVNLVAGKRNLLRFIDIKRVSKSGQISEIALKSKKENSDYGAGDFLRDIDANGMAVGLGVASIGIGVASMEIGGQSLIGILKELLAGLSKKNQIGLAFIAAGAAVIASTKVYDYINRRVQRVRRNMAKVDAVQNEMFEEMQNNTPSAFDEPYEKIATDIVNHPNLLSFYEEALRDPQKYNLSVPQRINIVKALREADSKIDDFERIKRGEPTKAELAAIKKQQEEDNANARNAKSLITVLKTQTAKLSTKSSESEIESIRGSIPEIKTTIENIKDESIKSGLLQELDVAEKQFESKVKTIERTKEEESKQAVKNIESKLSNVEKEIEKLSPTSKVDEINKVGDELSAISAEIDKLPDSSEKTRLQTRYNKDKASYNERIKVKEEEKTDKPKEKTPEELSDEKLLNIIEQQAQVIIDKEISALNLNNFTLPNIGNSISSLENYMSKIVGEEARAEAEVIINNVKTKYSEKYDKIKEVHSESLKSRTESDRIAEEIFDLCAKIRNGRDKKAGDPKTNNNISFLAFIETLKGPIADVKTKIDAVENVEDKTTLLTYYAQLEKDFNKVYRDLKTRAGIEEILEGCKNLTTENYIAIGEKLESLESIIYALGDKALARRFEFAESKYLKKRAVLMGTSTTEPFENINKKFNNLRKSIENIKAATKEADIAKVNELIVEIEADIEKLPSMQPHFKQKLRVAKEGLKNVEKLIQQDESERSSDKKLSDGISSFESLLVNLDAHTYNSITVSAMEEKIKELDQLFASETDNSNTNQHYKNLWKKHKAEYVEKRKNIETQIKNNNKTISNEIDQRFENIKKIISGLNKTNYKTQIRIIDGELEFVSHHIEQLKELVSAKGAVLPNSDKQKYYDALTEHRKSADEKINSLSEKVTLDINDPENIKYIEGEIAKFSTEVKNTKQVYENRALSDRLSSIKYRVYETNSQELKDAFEVASSEYYAKCEENIQANDNKKEDLKLIISEFSKFRVLMHEFKNVNSFDDTTKGVNTQDYLRSKLDYIKGLIAKLPDGSFEKQHFTQRHRDEFEFLAMKTKKLETLDNVNVLLQPAWDNLLVVNGDNLTVKGVDLLNSLNTIKNSIAKAEKILSNGDYRGKKVDNARKRIESYKEQLEKAEEKHKEEIQSANNESKAIYDASINKMESLLNGLSKDNYKASRQQFNAEEKIIRKLVFYGQIITAEESQKQQELHNKFNVKCNEVEKDALSEKESSYGSERDSYDEYVGVINDNFSKIETAIENLNETTYSEKEVIKIRADIDTLKNLDIKYADLKPIIAEKCAGFEQKLNEKELELKKEKGIDPAEAISHVQSHIDKLKKLVNSLNPSNFSSNRIIYDAQIKQIEEHFSAIETNEMISPEVKSDLKGQIDKLRADFDKADYRMRISGEISAEIDKFNDSLKMLDSTTMLNENFKELFEKNYQKLKGKVDSLGDNDISKKFQKVEAAYHSKKSSAQSGIESRAKNEPAYRKFADSKTIDTKGLSGDERSARIFNGRIQLGMINYTKSLSLAMANTQMGQDYPMVVEELKRYIVKTYSSSRVYEEVASQMINMETGEFVKVKGFSFVDPKDDPKLKELVEKFQATHRAYKGIRSDSQAKDRSILNSNARQTRVRLVSQLKNKLHISEADAEKLVTENGALVNNELTRGILSDTQINKLVERLKSQHSKIAQYDAASDSQKEEMGREIRKDIIRELADAYHNAISTLGKDRADAEFVSGCKAAGRDPQDVANLLGLKDVNFNAKVTVSNAKTEPEVVEEVKTPEPTPILTESDLDAMKKQITGEPKKSKEEYLVALREKYRELKEAIHEEHHDKKPGVDYKALKDTLSQEIEKILKDFKTDYGFTESENAYNEIKNKKSIITEQVKSIISKYNAKKYEIVSAKKNNPEFDDSAIKQEMETLANQMESLYNELKDQMGEKLSEDVKQLIDYCKSKGLPLNSNQLNRKKELTTKLQALASEYKTNKILFEKNKKDGSIEALEPLEQKLEEIMSQMNNIKGQFASEFDERTAAGAMKIIEKCEKLEVTEQDLKAGHMTLNEHKKRIAGKIDYFKSITDPIQASSVYDGILKAVIKAEDTYGRGCLGELYEEYASLEPGKGKKSLTIQDKNDMQGKLNQYRLSLKDPNGNAGKIKQEILSMINSYKTNRILTQELEEFVNTTQKTITKIEVEEAKDFVKDFDSNLTVDECKQEISNLLGEYRTLKAENPKGIVPNENEFKQKIGNYFKYVEKKFGPGELASYKEEVYKELNPEQQDEKVENLKGAIQGVNRSQEFINFLKLYNKLYLISKSNEKMSDGKSVSDKFNELLSSIESNSIGLTEKEVEIAKKLMKIAGMADEKAVQEVKEGKTTADEKDQALKNRIVGMINEGFNIDQILEMINSKDKNNRKMVQKLIDEHLSKQMQ